MVHQHFMLVEPMTVAENIVLGIEPGSPLALDLKSAEARVRALSAELGLAVDPAARAEDLSVGLRQRVELLKALYREARLLILDEPTAVLSPQAVAEMFAILRRMRTQGKTIVIVTHKLTEVLEHLRRGDGDARRPRRGPPQDRRDQRRRARPSHGGARRAAAGGQARSQAAGAGARRARPLPDGGGWREAARRRLVRGPRRGDRGHRRHRGQRPDRADRGPGGPGGRASPSPARSSSKARTSRPSPPASAGCAGSPTCRRTATGAACCSTSTCGRTRSSAPTTGRRWRWARAAPG